MGEVYLAKDTKLWREVALKVLHSTSSARHLERFLFEARITARFNHPNIVTIYEVGEFRGHPYLALEHLEGQTLRDRLLEAPMGATEAIQVGLAVARALAEAHSHHVLHRDLKPGNVMVLKDGRIRVLDFGLAQALSAPPDEPVENDLTDQTQEPIFDTVASVRGTPAYMSPEQWMGGEVGPATDIWALGIMLYELLVGKRPYVEKTVALLSKKIRSAEEVPLTNLPSVMHTDMTSLVRDCLQKDRDRRPSAERVVERLEALLESPEPPTAKRDRKVGLWVTVALGLVAGSSLFAFNRVLWPPPTAIDASVYLDASEPRRVEEPDAGQLVVRPDAGQTRRIWVDTVPTKVEVWTGKTSLGRTPLVGVDLPSSRLTLSFKKRGFHTERLVVEPGVAEVRLDRLRLRSTEVRVRARTTMQVSTLDGGRLVPAEIFLNDRYVGQSPLFLKKVRVGKYRLTAKLKGYRHLTKKVTISAKDKNRVVLNLERAHPR